jgi:hypothetical protein
MRKDNNAQREQYLAKLRDPRWQKKRLEILSRDEWKCKICGDPTTTLHVHHRYYSDGKEPWEYAKAALATLCEPCHQNETECSPLAEKLLLTSLKLAGCFSWEIAKLGSAFGENAWHVEPDIMTSIFTWIMQNADVQKDLLRRFEADPRKIARLDEWEHGS